MKCEWMVKNSVACFCFDRNRYELLPLFFGEVINYSMQVSCKRWLIQ